ncbi:MAG: RES family NAD+ phosphorylase [Geminicoccaceae bacterium]
MASLPEPRRTAILAPDDYTPGQALGRHLREAGSNGVVYPSVRHAGGTCPVPSAQGRPAPGAGTPHPLPL